MDCPCCRAPLRRASEMPEERRGMRSGDRWCERCDWIIPRESLLEDARPRRCPRHAAQAPV